MSPLPTGIDILAPNLDWLAAQFAVAIEDIATEDGGRGEQGFDEIGLRIQELSEWMEECVAEFEMRGMVVVLQAEGEGAENKEEKTAKELADEFLDKLAEELEEKSMARTFSEVERPVSPPIRNERDILQQGLTIPGLRVRNQGVGPEVMGVECCDGKRKGEDEDDGQAGKRRRMIEV